MATRKPAGEKTTRSRKAAPAPEAAAEAPDEALAPEVAAEAPVPEIPAPVGGISRMVVFFLDDQRYALPIERVQEIQQIVAYTEVPDATGITLGMVNLRGVVVPLVDLRMLVGLQPKDYHLETPMVICRVGDSLVALVVDEVEDVAEMPVGSLQSPSRLHALADRLLGVCMTEQGLVFLLDLERLIPTEELGVGAAAAGEGEAS